MRPIDADALTEFLKCLLPERGMWEIEGDTGKNAVCETVAEAIEMVKNMETIQPEKAQFSLEGTTKGATSEQPSIQPEPHEGEWIEISSINHTYKCSECGRLLVNITDGRNNVSKHYPYCHCGADMRGEQQK